MHDGHTHTHYCQHGSDDPMKAYIERAIEEGFKTYSITEHAPLPKGFLALKELGAPGTVTKAAMDWNDLEAYFTEMKQVKEDYKNDIDIKVGLEVDYLLGFEDETRDFLNTWGKELDDGILSVHFIPGAGGLRCIDYSLEDFKEGLLDFYGDMDKVVEVYYDVMIKSVNADLGPYKPKRIGHINLIQKFLGAFQKNSFKNREMNIMIDLFFTMQEAGYSMDCNYAGRRSPYYRDTYPPFSMAQLAYKMDIPIIFGSDSHAVSDR